MNTQQRIQKYREAPEVIQILCNSIELARTLEQLDSQFAIANFTKLSDVVGDTILGFYKTTDLPRLFQSELGMSADEAQKMMSELIEFLSPVIKREEETNNIKKEDLDRLAKTFETSNQNRQKEIVPEGKPTDVQPLRTMAADMNRVHGYGAYRDQNLINDDEPVIRSASQTDLLSPNVPPPPTELTDDLQAPDPDVGQIPIKRAE